MSSQKVGKKGLIIRSQARELVNNVSEFMYKEAEEGITIPIKNFRARTLAATRISKNTYHKIQKESCSVANNPGSSFVSPRKRRPKLPRKVDSISPGYIREVVHSFYLVDKRRPTLKLILEKIKEQAIIDEQLSESSLRRLLNKIGFGWRKSDDNKKVLMEKHDVRLKRIKYLKAIIEYRKERRNIVYADETYIHSSHTSYDDILKGIQKPIPKGQRLIIVHAGGENGFINNGLLIFRSGSKSGDFHDDMNHANFMRWTEQQLIPNLPPKSVVVVDNASYHNVPVEKKITFGNTKQEMMDWLKEKNIRFDENLTKLEIYELILANKDKYCTKTKLDELLEKHGHSVLRLPPYHPELNPIEEIWATVKNWVGNMNTTFKIADVEALTRQKFSEVTVENWVTICQHIKQYEQGLLDREDIFDESLEEFISNKDSSDESDCDSSFDSSSSSG